MSLPEKLIIWRDSVCAGDDCDAPHEIYLPVENGTLREAVACLMEANYLASISGGKATWILATGEHTGQPLAVIAQQWPEPRFLADPDSAISQHIRKDAKKGRQPHLYVRYWCQADPERVFTDLQQGKVPERNG